MKPSTAALACALVLAATGAARAQDAPAPGSAETDVIAIAEDSTGRLTVPVRLGEDGPFDFLIDTGSQNTVVSDRLIERLGLTRGTRHKVMGIAGTVAVDTVEIGEISLGRRSYYAIVAPVLERRNIGADGMLGLDSLQDQRVLIDFRSNTIAVNDARTLGGDNGFEIVVLARRRSGQLIMSDARIDGVRCTVVIDTGSDTSLGNRALQRALGRRGNTARQIVLHSVTGQELVADVGAARRLEMQNMNLSNVLIAFSDSPTFARLGLEREPTLFLGIREMRVFRRVAIDFHSRRVLFDLPEAGDPAYFNPPAPPPARPPPPDGG